MKNVRIVEGFPDDDQDDMLPEYRFDYSKSKPNHFAGQIPVTVVLEDDVAQVFGTSENVNNALRAILKALPETALPH